MRKEGKELLKNIYKKATVEAAYMSISRGMGKEDVVHIFSGTLFSHEKE